MVSGEADTDVRPLVRRRYAPLTACRELTIAFGPADLPMLRAQVTAYAAEFTTGDRLEDVVLVAHELATNVVRHGGGHGRLRLWRSGTRLVCRVSDTGPGISHPVPDGTEPPASRLAGGRGLWIARRLSILHIDTGPGGTTVTAQLPCGAWQA